MKENESAILQKSDPQQGTDAALQLSQALQQLVGASMKNCLQNMPEQIMQLSHQVHKIETKQQQSVYNFESIQQQLENLASVNKLLENASKTNHLLGKQHYDEHIIQPIVRSLFPVLDLVEDAQKHWSNSQQITELFNVVWSQMEQFMANYDVHIIKHDINDKFNLQTMKPVKWIPIEDSQLDGCVAESLQIGFQFGKERMLRLETVSLFKFQPSQTNTINPIKQENGGVL